MAEQLDKNISDNIGSLNTISDLNAYLNTANQTSLTEMSALASEYQKVMEMLSKVLKAQQSTRDQIIGNIR